jgi:hypothetical protein
MLGLSNFEKRYYELLNEEYNLQNPSRETKTELLSEFKEYKTVLEAEEKKWWRKYEEAYNLTWEKGVNLSKRDRFKEMIKIFKGRIEKIEASL